MTPRRALRAALQLALAGFVGWYVWEHWGEFRQVFAQATPVWGSILQSAFLVLLAYAVLIQTWRQVVQAWGERLNLRDATRVWFISNLGKYVPGKVWAIATMGTLAQEVGVSPVAAIGSAMVVQLVNLVTGFAVFFVAGAHAMHVPGAALIGVGLIGVALAASPWIVPIALRLVNRVTGRAVAIPVLPPAAIWWAATGTALAWCLYGVAFQWFAWGVAGGEVHGTLGDWTAVFVGPYLLGFIAVFAPGGIGAREVAMLDALQRTGLATGALAGLLVAASRIWLTILEIVPGVLFLLVRPLGRPVPPRISR